MNYSITEILEITGATLLNAEIHATQIQHIYFDTRRGTADPSGIFLAIDGKNADGHAYIREAYVRLRTRNFLVSKSIETADYEGANFLLVDDVVQALQALAIHHRSLFQQLPVIGITGSNGKTIVKEWIFQLCEQEFQVVRSPGSYNSQIGVPLSVLKMEEGDELAIFEAGISGAGEMLASAHVIQPELGIFTNIGSAHSAGFQSTRQKIKEKAKLFSQAKKIIYCRDHELVHEELDKLQGEKITWSAEGREATYALCYNDTKITINDQLFPLRFTDEISRENATHAIIAALELGVQEVKSGELTPLKMRLEMKQGQQNCFLINDAYSSDFDALTSALKILEQQQKRQSNTLILAPIEETSLSDEDVANEVARIVAAHDVQRVITVGQQLESLSFAGERQHFKHTNDLINRLSDLKFQNENILIKGARRFSLEQVFNKLSVKVHQTILEINLEAMRHNLMVFRLLLEERTKLMVVLKASGYGSGSKELSRFLAYQRVDYIAVAYADEGIELRKSGIEIPIMVMNPEESGFEAMVANKLEPEIYSVSQLRNFISYVPNGLNFPVHLKIETGMHRLGLEEEDMEDLGQCLLNSPSIKVASIFSHLVASDDPELDPFSENQVSQFLKAYLFISEKIGYEPIRHVLNSTGISRFRNYQMDMVRLGKGLHGISNDPEIAPKLQKVQTLKSRIAQIKQLKKGESVGYNRKYVAPDTRRVATVNLGYADGLPRNAGNERYQVLVNGKQPAFIVGNVCMDMCMLDVTEIQAAVGDEVLIFGEEWPIERLADVCETIPLEVLTRLAGRVHRVFLRE